jgi:membrane-bound metal-dependent hydrolase YbcI (DUF457 family)
LPNAKVHSIAGASAGAAWYVVYCRKSRIKVKFPDLLVASVIGLAGGLLADMFEPASDPNHRKFAHSILLALGLVVLIGLIWHNSVLNSEEQRLALGGLIVAYLSHLVLDSSTPSGILLIR